MLRQLEIVAGDGVAFSHALSHTRATAKEGGAVDMWVRLTLGWREIDGAWTVTHEHVSVPFEPRSGMASLTLRP